MSTVLSPTEQKIILHDVSWTLYQLLLANYQDSSSPRFAYDRGTLEIMILSARHEQPNRIIAALIETVANEGGIDFINLGSTTFNREDLAKGFEPDSCFYFQNVHQVRGKEDIDLQVDPPPDLIVEIDITHPSLPKLPIYEQVKVPEVWQYDGEKLTILLLENGAYRESADSRALPGVTARDVTRFVEESRYTERPQWNRAVLKWARSLN